MKIYLCQTSPKIGAFESNFNEIKRLYLESLGERADICLLPELALSGYMLEDLLAYEGFVEDIISYNEKLVALTKDTCLLLPSVTKDDVGNLYNSVIAAQNGEVIGRTSKVQLPNYGVFDEKRYFTPGKPSVIQVNGFNVGVPICEDIWSKEVVMQLKEQGAQILLVPNASPFDTEKFEQRCLLLKARYEESGLPIIYCNQVIGQDGIIFDGGSLCFDGRLNIIGKRFTRDKQMLEFHAGKVKSSVSYQPINAEQEIVDAMILGVRDYVRNNGFQKVILGLSGGIDSALVAYIAVMALGSSNVSAYMLPSIYTSEQSKIDAASLAKNLNINLDTINISNICNSFAQEFESAGGIEEGSIVHQNIQSRVRGSILMSKANRDDALLLTTGNKSEYAVGYATIYGDMNGAFNPIKDVYKTGVYELVRYINRDTIIIPKSIVEKEPSAELRFDQKDSDSLPDYKVLDKILYDYIEKKQTKLKLQKYHDPGLVKRVVCMVENSEFKRRQSAPGVKISSMSFNKDRRMQITHFYK